MGHEIHCRVNPRTFCCLLGQRCGFSSPRKVTFWVNGVWLCYEVRPFNSPRIVFFGVQPQRVQLGIYHIWGHEPAMCKISMGIPRKSLCSWRVATIPFLALPSLNTLPGAVSHPRHGVSAWPCRDEQSRSPRKWRKLASLVLPWVMVQTYHVLPEKSSIVSI